MSHSDTTQPNYRLTRHADCYCCGYVRECYGRIPLCAGCDRHVQKMKKLGSDDTRSIRAILEEANPLIRVDLDSLHPMHIDWAQVGGSIP